MTDAFATLGTATISRMVLLIGQSGPWVADIDLVDDTPISLAPFAAVIKIGSQSLVGTVDPRYNGVFGIKRSLRVIGGAAGWRTVLRPASYHADNGVTARQIAEEAASACGERLSITFAPASARIGIDYLRTSGPASHALEDAIGDASWWVELDGTTSVGTRAATPVAEAPGSPVEVLEVEPDHRVLQLACDAVSVLPGAVVTSNRLDSPHTVHEIEYTLTGTSLRAVAWCNIARARDHGRIGALLESLVRRVMGEKLFGCWRYRVESLSGDRVNLQSVSNAAGVPDAIAVSMSPGVAGWHATLTLGAEVLVEFLEGDRTLPRITHFAGKDGVGFEPVSLAFDGGASPVAGVGDFVDIQLPAGTPLVLTVAGGATTVVAVPTTLIGFIQSGNSRLLK